MAVHQLAVVDPQAQVHEGAEVGPFCMVGPEVILEKGVNLKNHVTVTGKTIIGEGTVVYPGAVVGGDPQDLKFRGENSETIIGKNCRIHEYVTVSKGTAGGGMKTVVGDECLIMAYAHIAHDCLLANNVVVGNSTQLAGHVKIGRKAWLAGMVGVHHFVTIGELAMVGARSGVRFDAPPFTMVEGYPSEPRTINKVGLRRDGWSDEDIRAVKDAFRKLWKCPDGSPLSKALEALKDSDLVQNPRVAVLCEWLTANLDTSIKGRMLEAER